MSYRTVPLSNVEVGDDLKYAGLAGTVCKISPHSNGYSYSVWLTNPLNKAVEGFEWILSENPQILKRRKV